MRQRRLKVRNGEATYHCMTRTVNGERLFGDREKEVLRKMVWQVADFSGVEVLTYCVMSNHFHVLLKVPVRGEISDRELLRRYGVLYPRPTAYQTGSIPVLKKQLAENDTRAEAIRRQLQARMGDVSEFMKTLKQRFSIWFNHTHGRYGTLWAERFKSVLVQGDGNPLQTIAAYIDLNPVRAGIVEDPKDYRFCGYAEAVAGRKVAKSGLSAIWASDAAGGEEASFAAALRAHRCLIFGRQASAAGLSEDAKPHVLEQLARGDPALPLATVLRCRIRYFTDGAILGSRDFVERQIASRQLTGESKRAPMPHPLIGADWGDLATVRGLRHGVFS